MNRVKILELKYRNRNRKLSNVWEYHQLRLVYAGFTSICL